MENIQKNIDNAILPQRFIPFDIGAEINAKALSSMNAYFEEQDNTQLKTPSLLCSLSTDIISKIKISEGLRLYLFSYGIGVFVLEDELHQVSGEYAVEYCDYRKQAHTQLLEFKKGETSVQIKRVISDLRSIVKNNRGHLRPSASDKWEHHGLSYVMTISYIFKKGANRNDYDNFAELDKKNLHIMLQPSIAHKEDTMAIDEIETRNFDFDPYNFDVDKLEAPKNWIKAEDCAIYISWAAVVVYLQKFIAKYMEIVECLEVELQAMWLYTYCRYLNLKGLSTRKKLSSVDLKREKYNFQKKYNEFISDNDASIPIFIFDIRNELINTSGINHEKDNYMEYMEFCIDEAESIERERQRKYSVMNEVLLFIIAFIQVAPMVYSAMIGEYSDLELWPIITMIIFIIISIILIIQKD